VCSSDLEALPPRPQRELRQVDVAFVTTNHSADKNRTKINTEPN
jgi:hypothetical protein